MDNLNTNLINLIASFKKTGQSDEVIKQSLWQLGMIPEVVESHLDYYNKHTAQINKDINIVKENKDMKLTLEKLHTQSEKAIAALEEMKSDNSLGFSATSAKKTIEGAMAQLQISKDECASILQLNENHPSGIPRHEDKRQIHESHLNLFRG